MRGATRAASPRLAAGTHRVAQVLRLLIVQYFPLLIDSLPPFEDPVHGRSLVDDKAWAERRRKVKGRTSNTLLRERLLPAKTSQCRYLMPTVHRSTKSPTSATSVQLEGTDVMPYLKSSASVSVLTVETCFRTEVTIRTLR